MLYTYPIVVADGGSLRAFVVVNAKRNAWEAGRQLVLREIPSLSLGNKGIILME